MRTTKRSQKSTRKIIVAAGEISVAGYVPEDEDLETAPREAVNVDPEAVDRLRGDRRTQNQLAAAVERLGLVPHKGRKPDFDLGWWDGEVFCVARSRASATEPKNDSYVWQSGKCFAMRISSAHQ